jgi:nucleoside-diphosphate-sugar epimerase
MATRHAGVMLITGALGLVGRAVSRLARERGWSVVATDVIASSETGHEVHLLDARDGRSASQLCKQENVDTIVHCGGFSGGMVGADRPAVVVDVNVRGTAELLEVARQRSIRRFVYASTATVYGRTDGMQPLDESTPVRPVGIYGTSKAAAELVVSSYRADYGLDAVSLRLCWIYGPFRTTDCVIRDMILSAQAGNRFELPYGRDFPRQYLYVDDAAEALLAAATVQTVPLPTYNITGGSVVTLGDLGDLVTRIVPGADVTVAPGDDPGDEWQGRFDTAAAERDLNFTAAVGLEEGITRYSAWLAERSTTSPVGV